MSIYFALPYYATFYYTYIYSLPVLPATTCLSSFLPTNIGPSRVELFDECFFVIIGNVTVESVNRVFFQDNVAYGCKRSRFGTLSNNQISTNSFLCCYKNQFRQPDFRDWRAISKDNSQAAHQ